MSTHGVWPAGTPGPWHVVDTLESDDDDVPPTIEIHDATGGFIASVNDIEDAERIAKVPIAISLVTALDNLLTAIAAYKPDSANFRKAVEDARKASAEWANA